MEIPLSQLHYLALASLPAAGSCIGPIARWSPSASDDWLSMTQNSNHPGRV